jgi:hypothetical protein
MKLSFKFFSLVIAIAIVLSGCAWQGAGGIGKWKIVEYSLTTAMADGMMVYVGVGANRRRPQPCAERKCRRHREGHFSSGDGTEHDISLPDFNVMSEHVVGKGSSTTVTFVVDKGGSFAYFCTCQDTGRQAWKASSMQQVRRWQLHPHRLQNLQIMLM